MYPVPYYYLKCIQFNERASEKYGTIDIHRDDVYIYEMNCTIGLRMLNNVTILQGQKQVDRVYYSCIYVYLHLLLLLQP